MQIRGFLNIGTLFLGYRRALNSCSYESLDKRGRCGERLINGEIGAARSITLSGPNHRDLHFYTLN